MNGSDITGYLWRGETFCPICIRELFWSIEDDPGRSTEEVLDRAAAERGIDRHDEAAAGTHRFPQPLYRDDVTTADVCIFCGSGLLPLDD